MELSWVTCPALHNSSSWPGSAHPPKGGFWFTRQLSARKELRRSSILAGSVQLPMSRFEFERFHSLRAVAFWVLVALAAMAAHAQNLQDLSHQSWSTEEGLPQSSVHAIAQTSDGYIWAGTEAGLVRFDGLQFKVFDQTTDTVLRSSDICCLVSDGEQGLWIGTRDGLVHRTTRGLAWYGEKDGLPSAEIIGLSRNQNGSLFVSTSAGSMKWPDPSTGSLRASSFLPMSNAGSAWSWTPKEVQLHSGTSVLRWRTGADHEGHAWVGMNSGAVVIDPATHTVTALPAMKGLSVLSILHDDQGNHWIGTEFSGLHIFRQLRFHDVPALAQVATTSVVQTTDGAFWVGTRDGGLYRMRDGVVDQPIADGSLTSPVILCLQPALDGSGFLWVGTPDGLNLVSPGKKVQKITSANGLPDEYIRSLAAVPDGSIWVGTRHGLDHIQGQKHTVFTSMDGLGGDLVGIMLVEPTGGVWIATSGGLSRLDADGSIRNFTTQKGLTFAIVTAMAKDNSGRLWVATKDGNLSVFDGQRFKPLIQIVEEGSFAQVQSLTFDRDGSLWVRMNRGIVGVRSAQVALCLSQHPCVLQKDAVVRYGSPDGLRNDEAVPTAMAVPWLTPQGELWFPTRAGVAIADTHGVHEDAKAPPVVVQQLLIDDAPVDFLGRVPAFAFGSHRISIDYAGLDFTSPSGVHYRYHLEGFDKEWQYVENRRSVTFTNLAPKLYTFHVQARSNDGDWSEVETTIQFRVLSPFYRRWWFVALALALAATLLAGMNHLRSRVIRQRFEAVLAERNRMAREIHDTLTQDFVSTCLQLDIVAQQLQGGRVNQAIEQVKQARRLVTEGLAEARQSIWELRSNNGRETLPNRMAHLIERETYAAVKPHLEVRGAYRRLDPRIELEILRLANEAMINVVRHSGTDRTNVVLYYSTETLMLTVEDFGRGFTLDVAAQEQGQGHFGLIGMRERASVVDGTLEIVSVEGQGTTVRLRVPLSADGEGQHS
jgi:ligand-binding sensor domain-containing protein/signal transduction histidine kinase